MYEDCPVTPLEYDKDYYLSSTRYSRFIDKQIKKKKFLHTSCFILILFLINN